MTDSQPNRIAVASGKGGTGKTLVSTHLAHTLSQSKDCVLVDLDVEEPNAHLFYEQANPTFEMPVFKQIPDWQSNICTRCGQCAEICAYHAVVQLGEMIMVLDELCHSCYACSELCPVEALPMKNHEIGSLSSLQHENLTIFTGKLRLGEEQAVPLIKKSIALSNQEIKDQTYIIYDSPPGTSCPVVAAVGNANLVLLITEPTPFGLNDLKIAIETMRQMDKPLAVILNRDGIGNDEVEQYCDVNNIPLIAKIPYNEDIARNYAQGKLSNEVPQMADAMKAVEEYIQKIQFHHA